MRKWGKLWKEISYHAKMDLVGEALEAHERNGRHGRQVRNTLRAIAGIPAILPISC